MSSWCAPALLMLGWACPLLACQQRAVDAHPADVVEAFIDRMRSVHGDLEKGELAAELIWSEGRASLAERARRASAASGRPVTLGEMLVPSKFSLRTEPTSFRTEIKGRWSRVTILGADGTLVEASCVREGDHWRVVVDFPEPPLIHKRE